MSVNTVETVQAVGVTLSIPSGALRHMCAVAPVFTGNIPTALTGVRLEYEPGVFRVVSTDRYRMAVGELHGEHVTDTGITPGGVLVLGKSCADIAKALPRVSSRTTSPCRCSCRVT